MVAPVQDLYRRLLTTVEKLEPERLALPRRGAMRAFAPFIRPPSSRLRSENDHPNAALAYSGHLQLEVVVGLQGCAELALAGQRYALAEGDIAMVPSNTLHVERLYSRRQDYHLLWLCLWPNRLTVHSSIYHSADRFQIVRHARIGRQDELWRCMESAVDEAVAGRTCWLNLARARLVEGLVLAVREMEENGDGLESAQVQRNAIDAAKAFIQSHFSEDLTLERIAGRAALSPSYFSALFSRCENRTVFDYLHEVRIDEAKRLLRGSSYPIKQIARRVGIASPAYFCRVFRRLAGRSAQEYRSLQSAARAS